MSDILTAYGILLAVYTYLESLYHQEIEWAKSTSPQTIKRENKISYDKMIDIRKTKVYTLLGTSTLFAILMLPNSIEIIKSSFDLIIHSNAVYDLSRTTMVLFNFAFVIVTVIQIKNLVAINTNIGKHNYK